MPWRAEGFEKGGCFGFVKNKTTSLHWLITTKWDKLQARDLASLLPPRGLLLPHSDTVYSIILNPDKQRAKVGMGKKKIKPGLIEADSNSLAIIVNYVEEVTEEDGHVTRTQKMKKVRLVS